MNPSGHSLIRMFHLVALLLAPEMLPSTRFAPWEGFARLLTVPLLFLRFRYSKSDSYILLSLLRCPLQEIWILPPSVRFEVCPDVYVSDTQVFRVIVIADPWENAPCCGAVSVSARYLYK